MNVPLIEVEPVTPKLPVIKADPVNGNAAPPPADVRAKDAVKACVAYEAVPIKAPVNDPVNDAVTDVAVKDALAGFTVTLTPYTNSSIIAALKESTAVRYKVVLLVFR